MVKSRGVIHFSFGRERERTDAPFCVDSPMSRFAHRQPVCNWSTLGVALLSTLLLSPAAGTALWHALFQGAPLQRLSAQERQPVPTPERQTDQRQAPARRVSPEEETLRRAAESGQLRAIRFDTDPDYPEAATVALVVRSRGVLLVPDDGAQAVTARFPFGQGLPLSTRALSQASPRAPPSTLL